MKNILELITILTNKGYYVEFSKGIYGLSMVVRMNDHVNQTAHKYRLEMNKQTIPDNADMEFIADHIENEFKKHLENYNK